MLLLHDLLYGSYYTFAMAKVIAGDGEWYTRWRSGRIRPLCIPRSVSLLYLLPKNIGIMYTLKAMQKRYKTHWTMVRFYLKTLY